MKPKRIQRKRTKGWRMPERTYYVGRPTEFGNPFDSVSRYREWLAAPEQAKLREEIWCRLRGKDLACWCPLDQPCHADVLLELANAERSRT